ncbi:MAG: FecR domain-containing protein [Kiritimatiellia bacterium]|nr:FecR domain-containing protein [Kiritimatiellia bacterium]
MKTGFLALTAALLLGISGVRAADPIGSVIALQGRATATSGNDARNLALRAEVFAGDSLRTEPGSRVQILFVDDSLFSQGENSETLLDEYVFDPDAREKNSFKARVGRGAFRVVTGKITELNPDRFQIQTGRSTIGIRGCGLLGDIGPDRDEFCVDFVRPGTEILIGLLRGGPRPIRFTGPGFGYVDDRGRLGQGPFDPDLFRALLLKVMPGGSSIAGGGGAPPDTGNPLLHPLFGDSGQIFLSRSLDLPGSKEPAPSSSSSSFSVGPGWQYFGYASALRDMFHNPYPEMPESAYSYFETLGSANGVYDDPDPSDAFLMNEGQTQVALNKMGVALPAYLRIALYNSYDAYVPVAIVDPPNTSQRTGEDNFIGAWGPPPPGMLGVVENRAQGSDWVWGEWELTLTSEYSTEILSGFYAAGRTLDALQFDALRQGSQIYSLHSNPAGIASAWVTDGVLARRLDGTANLNVTLGGSMALWEGVFRLANGAGDRLDFDVASTPITANGHLQGIPSMYSLLFNGSTHENPYGGVTGSLVGPGPNTDGRPPVTGAVGTGRFWHNEGPTVEMTYGTSLQPPSHGN